MSRFASGKFAKRISDRSGMAFPYNEMVEEWTGARVHYTEYESKHPQLEPRPIVQDPQSLQNARGQIAVSRVFVGGANGPISSGRTIVKPDGADAPYDGKGFGIGVKQFETADQVVTHTRAVGSTFAITTKNMMALELQAPTRPAEVAINRWKCYSEYIMTDYSDLLSNVRDYTETSSDILSDSIINQFIISTEDKLRRTVDLTVTTEDMTLLHLL